MKPLTLLILGLLLLGGRTVYAQTIRDIQLVEDFRGKFVDGVPQWEEVKDSAKEGKLRFGYVEKAHGLKRFPSAVFSQQLVPKTNLYGDYTGFSAEYGKHAHFYAKNTLLLADYKDKKVLFRLERGFTEEEAKALLEIFGAK